MTILLVILHVFVCFVLVLVILLQAGRGQGLGGASFGFGGGVQTLFGTKAADFLTKATSVCAILFLITCISLDFVEAHRSRSIIKAPSEKAMSKEDIAKIKEALEKLKLEAEKEKLEGKTPQSKTQEASPITSNQNQATVATTSTPEQTSPTTSK